LLNDDSKADSKSPYCDVGRVKGEDGPDRLNLRNAVWGRGLSARECMTG